MVKALDNALKALLIFLVGVLTTVVFLQVLIRFVFKSPLPWTEEVSRIAFVYCIFIGAIVGMRERAHIRVDALLVMLPPGAQRVLSAASNLIVSVFLIYVIWQGVEFVRLTGIQMTPVLLIPFQYLYMIIPISGALMLLYLVLGILNQAWTRRQG